MLPVRHEREKDIREEQAGEEVLELAGERQRSEPSEAGGDLKQGDRDYEGCGEQAAQTGLLDGEEQREERSEDVELHFNFEAPGDGVAGAWVSVDEVVPVAHAGQSIRQDPLPDLLLTE